MKGTVFHSPLARLSWIATSRVTTIGATILLAVLVGYTMTARPLYIQALGVVAATSLLSIIIPFEFSLLLFLILFQVRWYGPLFTIQQIEVQVYDLIYVGWLIRVGLKLWSRDYSKRPLPRRWFKSRTVLLLFLGWSMISTFVAAGVVSAREWQLMLMAWLRFIQLASVALFMPYLMGRKEQLRRLYTMISGVAIVQLMMSFTRWVPYVAFGLDWLGAVVSPAYQELATGRSPILSYARPDSFRLTGTFGDPATFGDFLLFALSLVLALSMAEPPKERWRFEAVSLALVTGIVLTQTRTTFLGLIFTGAVWMVRITRHAHAGGWSRGKALRRVGVSIVAILIMLYLQLTSRLQPLLRLQYDIYAAGRLSLAQRDLGIFRNRPLIGVGWSGARFYGVDLPWGEPVYTRIAAELGAIGLILLAGLFVSLLVDSRRLARVSSGTTKVGALWVLLGIAGFIGLGFGDVILYGGSHVTLTLFVLIGVLFTATSLDNTRQGKAITSE